MATTNFVTVVGGLTRDAEVKRIGVKQTAKASLSVASSEKVGEDERVTYVDVEAWQWLAEACEGLNKGTKVTVVGRLKFESWEKEGVKRSRLLVTADTIAVNLTGKPRDGAGVSRSQAPAASGTTVASKIDDDDVPF